MRLIMFEDITIPMVRGPLVCILSVIYFDVTYVVTNALKRKQKKLEVAEFFFFLKCNLNFVMFFFPNPTDFLVFSFNFTNENYRKTQPKKAFELSKSQLPFTSQADHRKKVRKIISLVYFFIHFKRNLQKKLCLISFGSLGLLQNNYYP